MNLGLGQGLGQGIGQGLNLGQGLNPGIGLGLNQGFGQGLNSPLASLPLNQGSHSLGTQALNPAFGSSINQLGNLGNGLGLGQGVSDPFGRNDRFDDPLSSLGQPSGLDLGNRFDAPKYQAGSIRYWSRTLNQLIFEFTTIYFYFFEMRNLFFQVIFFH